MLRRVIQACALLILVSPFAAAQTAGEDSYIGYSLTRINDESNDVIYATDSTPANVSTSDPPPDVYLNATVNVGSIDLTVANLSAKVNLDVQVLQLLQFNAGVDVSIDNVFLGITNVSAQVQLEARLSNLVLMISDVLDSVDLNPALATLGQAVNSTLNSTAAALSGTSSSNSNVARSLNLNLVDNILYSVNNYAGHTHTNRILAQNGSIIDQSLDNDGNTFAEQVVGYYATDMTSNGYDQEVLNNGQTERELQYVYQPYAGLQAICAIFLDATGKVASTQVLSESSGGGSSTVVGSLV